MSPAARSLSSVAYTLANSRIAIARLAHSALPQRRFHVNAALLRWSALTFGDADALNRLSSRFLFTATSDLATLAHPSTQHEHSAKKKGKRGRPKKKILIEEFQNKLGEQKVERKRGRPKKQTLPEDSQDTLEDQKVKRKRKRNRSKKETLIEVFPGTLEEQKIERKRDRSKKETLPELSRPEECDPDSQEPEKSSSGVTLSEEQQAVLRLIVDKGESVFFTGPAGTGKSFLLKEIISKLEAKHVEAYNKSSTWDEQLHWKNYVGITASTGIAALHIGGQTLHSWAGIGPGDAPLETIVQNILRSWKTAKRWRMVRVLIIDEVSMVDGDLFDQLDLIARIIRQNHLPFGGIQLVISGDFFQLPPVSSGKIAKFCFEAATWPKAVKTKIGLTHIYRQRETALTKILNEAREGRLSQHSIKTFRSLDRPLTRDNLNPTRLFPLRSEVNRENQQRMDLLDGEIFSFNAKDGGLIEDETIRSRLLSNCPAPKTLELKKGAQVMLIKNIDQSLANGSLGKVIGFMDVEKFCGNPDMEILKYVEKPSTGETSNGKMKPMPLKESLNEDEETTAVTIDRGLLSNPKLIGAFIRKFDYELFPLVLFSVKRGGKIERIIRLCHPVDWEVQKHRKKGPNDTKRIENQYVRVDKNYVVETLAMRSQVPLILAWALTIHKSQGQTMDFLQVDLHRVFEKGQAYVALSRATDMDGLQVLNFHSMKVVAHEKVKAFYTSLANANSVQLPGAN